MRPKRTVKLAEISTGLKTDGKKWLDTHVLALIHVKRRSDILKSVRTFSANFNSSIWINKVEKKV